MWSAADPAVDVFGLSDFVASAEALDPKTRLVERILLGLRLSEGIDTESATRDTGEPFWTEARDAAVARLERAAERIELYLNCVALLLDVILAFCKLQ